MTDMIDYTAYTIEELHEKLVSKEVTAEQLILSTYERIAETDPQLQAFLTLTKEEAVAKAKALDETGIDPTNLLAGIPIAIKDNIITKGVCTTAASKMLEHFVPVYNATVMDKVEEHDMIQVGKVNMDEFAMGGSTENSAFQVTRNPWNFDKVPGGSSGGSAAAVASGQVPVSLGSDTGGSIRQPAAFTGIVGMKPTYGRVSRNGLIAFASSLDQIGPLTRTVKDNALVLTAISGHDPKDSTSYAGEPEDFTRDLDKGVKGMRIGVPKEYLQENGIDPDIVASIREAIETFKSLGAIVEEVTLPHSEYGVAAYYILSSAEASSNLQRYDGIRYGFRAEGVKNLEELYVKTRTEGFGAEVKRRILLGTYSLSSGSYDAHFKKAAQARTMIHRDFAHVFSEYDLILGPTTTTTAYNLGGKIENPLSMYLADVLTVPVNLAGVPAISIPCGFSKGLPIGMQLIGKHFDEKTVYRAAYTFEQHTQFHKRKPSLSGGEHV